MFDQKLIAELLDNTKARKYSPSFLGLEGDEASFSQSMFSILPIPYDLTSTYHKGADRGPAALLSASVQLERYDIETASEPCTSGISTLSPLLHDGDPETLAQILEGCAEWLLSERKIPIFLGGDHSVTPGLVKGCFNAYPDLSVLQLDAHGDTRESYEGSRYNHACVMARVREFCPAVGVGLRAIDKSELPNLSSKNTYFAHNIMNADNRQEWQEKVSSSLSQNVYVTIDLDCFDPSLMPSTGTPEPGGLDWFTVVSLLRLIAQRHHIVGFDIVELLPRESNPAPDFVAAKLLYQFVSYIQESETRE